MEAFLIPICILIIYNISMAKPISEYSKKKSIFKRIMAIVGCIVIVASIALASFLIFHNVYYTPFWVNGQSMYPTLNKDAKYQNGNLIGETGTADVNSYDIDYGFMDEHQSAIENIKRFDIIICSYSSSDTSSKIKRVIALPGETFYINNSDDNGSLYVLSDGSYNKIIQPIDETIIKKASYPDTYAKAYTLSDNEYFVMGDNRSHSYDSRSVGPIEKEWIIGVAKGLCGRATLKYDENHHVVIDKVSKFWPRYF